MVTAAARNNRKAGRIRTGLIALVEKLLELFQNRGRQSHKPRLELPDGAVQPVPPFEQETDGERAALIELQKLAATSVVERLRDALENNPIAKALRDAHPKAHGCLRAQFIVNDDLPSTLSAGVFQAGATYDARVRFSNTSATPNPDKKGDGRGMAIKLMGVRDESLLTGEHRDRVGRNTQDFVLVDFPTFFVSTPREYLRFMTIISYPPLKRWPMFFFFFLVRPRKFYIFMRTASIKIDSPLRESYHSMSPYLLGDKVVRYKVTPSGPRGGRGKPRVDKSKPCFLRQAIIADLNNGPAEFDFSVQVLRRPTPRLVEDPTRRWSKFESDVVRVGRIIIQPQEFDTNTHNYDCEKSVFNPWNALPEHRPLGGINRSRFGVYMAVSKTRHNLNMVE